MHFSVLCLHVYVKSCPHGYMELRAYVPVINPTRILSERPLQRLRSHPFLGVMTTCLRTVVSAWLYGVAGLHTGN